MYSTFPFAFLLTSMLLAYAVSLPLSVGQTKKENASETAAMRNLNDILRSLTGSDPSLNGHVSRALNDFVSTILPAHCQQIQQMQTEFFNGLKQSNSLKLDTQTTDAFEELMKSMMPAVCGKERTKNLVLQSSNTNNFFDQFERFGKLLNFDEKNAVGPLGNDNLA